ncbi:hypothetical protein ACPCC3_13590 [Streptomyces cellulosae]|uniref:hypothetical protein n=1 Tax=Streptomyces sp. SID4956 TaxID=2690290 RepID=UPI001371EFE0|nr:hypothetical protein [Streptomyces sp. SID4956]
MEDPEASPALDGRTVDVVNRASEWEPLTGLLLKELKGEGTAAEREQTARRE